MGGVNRRDRDPKPTSEFDSSELVELTKMSGDALANELDPPTVRMAAGTTPPQTESAAAAAEAITRSRTTTQYDPLTTSLLAEVTRRTQTMDEMELELEAAAANEARSDEPPTASPRLIRRRP